jgi:crotonobetainyl-CoA:carnitine CoA-transferase CaiB-like acyl-CoA transferase
VLERNMIIETENQAFGRMRHVGTPIRIPGQDRETHEPAPDLGEDTDEVLADYLRYSPDQIERLRTAGAI